MNQLKSKSQFFFQRWKIGSQILCFAMIIQLIISIMVFILSITLLNLTIEYLKQASLVSIQMENNHQLDRFIELQTDSSNNYFDNQFSKLSILNELFQFNQKKTIQIEDPLQCLNSTFGYDKYANLTQFCFSYFGNQSNLNQSLDNKFRQLSSTMSQYIPLSNRDGILYFTSTTPDLYFSAWNSTIKSTFVPNQRQWYNDHIKNMNQQSFVMSAPYLSQVDQIRVALTRNLSLLDNEFVGIVAEDIDFRLMTKFEFENIEMQMVNENDQLIISDLYKKNEKKIFKIYDEKYSGISKSDWYELKEQSNKLGQHTQYIYSSIFQKQLLISIIKLETLSIYIILTINDSKYQNDQMTLIKYFDEFKINYRNLSFFLYIDMIVLTLLFQYIFIQWMQQDILKIKGLAFRTIYNQHYYKTLKQKLQVPLKTPSFRDLYLAFERFTNFHSEKSKKSEICKFIENLEYPKIYAQEKFEFISELEILCELEFPYVQIKNKFKIFLQKKKMKWHQRIMRYN